MELQQQQQQVVQLEGLENATARTLLGKLINVLLAVMAVLLVFVSTVANCVVPLMKTRSRTLSTLLLVIFLAFLWRNWEAMSQYLDRFLLHPRWPSGALLLFSFQEGTEGREFKDFDSKMETNTASVALSTGDGGTQHKSGGRTNPTTSFSRFFQRRSEFVYILIFFRLHKLYCWVSYYLLLEMMQVVLIVLIVRIYIYAISWVLRFIDLTGVVLTCTGWRSLSSFLIP